MRRHIANLWKPAAISNACAILANTVKARSAPWLMRNVMATRSICAAFARLVYCEAEYSSARDLVWRATEFVMYVEREKTVLVITKPESDRFGTHFVSSRLFAAEYLRWGLRPEFIDLTGQSELDRAVTLLKEGHVALAHCEQGCGLELSVRTGSARRNLFEYFKVPAVAHIRDYPFCEWMRPRLLGAGSTAVVFHTDELAPELVPKLGISSGQHLHAPHVYLDYRQPGRADI